jgi:hypothetical protein
MPAKVTPALGAAAFAVTAAMAISAPAEAKSGLDAGAARPAALQEPRIAGRRTCPLGQHYSTYYRRCVWWLPVRS